MKKRILAVFLLSLILALSGCSSQGNLKSTIEGNMKTYQEMRDGTWTCDELSYKYRLELKGKLPNATCDLVLVYLSNTDGISYEEAYQAAIVNNKSEDYFALEDAVLVEMRVE